MQTGRPSKHQRPPFGERLHSLREAAGLSQEQLAAKLGLTQRAYAYWERNPVALRPDQLIGLSEALGIGVDSLIGQDAVKPRGSGPAGRMRRLFESASALPRNQQQKVIALLEAFVAQHAQARQA